MNIESPLPNTEPPHDCALCPRLVETRAACRTEQPEWWNAPVRAFGDPDAWLAIVGLAPGKQGANRTGIPFNGDTSGDLLWAALATHGFEAQSPKGLMIFNAVRCLPPGNKPTPEELRTCRPFLRAGFEAMPNLRVVIALGATAHQSAVKANGEKLPKRRFAHGAVHHLLNGRILVDSYHPSRLNQNVGRVTLEMMEEIVGVAKSSIPL